MRKKKNTKSRAVDLLLILLCFAGTGVSGIAFWREYNRTLVKLNEEPVGSIVFKNRTAHRKIENRVAWDRLKQESPVYNGDTIRTAEASEAFITFEDELTKINLYENTLIQIFYDSRGARIDFFGGKFDVNSGGRSVFISNGAFTIEVESGSQASFNRGGDSFSLAMLNGHAKFDDGTELESGGIVSFLNDGTLDTSPAIAVTSFGSFARILASADGVASVVFSWNTVNFGPDTHVILEVSRDRRFSRIVQTRDVRGASSVTVPLETGEYWWRAYPVQGDNRESPRRGYTSGRIEALPFAAVVAVTPSPSQEFTFSGESSVSFSWTIVEGAENYLLEISGDPNIESPVVSRRVQGASVVQTGLEPGRWYWRVTPVLPEEVKGTALPSETGVFSIERGVPPVPSLSVPAQNGVIGMDHPRLVWKYDPGVVFWTVEVADNPEMSNPLLQQDSTSNFYTLPAGTLQKGKEYFWRVIARGAQNASPPSLVYSFTTEEHLYRQKAIFPPDDYFVTTEELERMRFTYQSDASFRNYFQVSSQYDFSSLEINEPVETGSTYPVSGLEPGIWYWRIYADDKSGLASTAPRRLNIVSTSEAPRIRSPVSLPQGSALELNWDPLYFASYQINVYNADNPDNPVEQQLSENNSAVLSTSSLEPGDYIVSVVGFNPESPRSVRIAGAPAQTSLTVTPVAPPLSPTPPIVIIPVVAVIPEPEPVVAVVPEPEPVVPEPVIAVIPEPKPVVAVVPEPEPEPVVPEPVIAVIPEPEPVVAVVPESEPEPVAPEPVIAVIPPPPSVQPTPVQPTPVQPKPVQPKPVSQWAASRPIPGSFPPDGYILSREQLVSARSVNFTWEGKGREYRFTLYRANGEVVVPSSVINVPSFTMQNPGIMEPGDYVWEVFERDRRGRLGESTVARFTVREGPPVLRTLSTNDPGVLYGNR
jgi:hypothetical protein